MQNKKSVHASKSNVNVAACASVSSENINRVNGMEKEKSPKADRNQKKTSTSDKANAATAKNVSCVEDNPEDGAQEWLVCRASLPTTQCYLNGHGDTILADLFLNLADFVIFLMEQGGCNGKWFPVTEHFRRLWLFDRRLKLRDDAGLSS